MMNLTRQLNRACEDLNKNVYFNKIWVLEASTQSEEQKRKDAIADNLTEEEIENYINNYCCVSFHLDVYGYEEDVDNRYVETSFNFEALEWDFRQFLLQYIPDESCFPKTIDLEGRDNEFIIRGNK